MTRIDASLITPIYAKQSEDMPRPKDPVYYLLAADNLYLCRNHPQYTSCVPAPQWPTELASHVTSLVPNYPRIPRDQLEQICGFFGYLSDEWSAEAIALLAWDEHQRQVRTIVPRQVAAVSQGKWGPTCPIGVKYEIPRDLPSHWSVFCDIHSHCDMAAFASQTDIDDEDSRTGLHVVVGRLHREPPEFHVEAVVDGTRFLLDWQAVSDGYRSRTVFPRKWLEQVVVTNYATFRDFAFDEEDENGTAKDL
jgi:hypothetical protein